MVQYSSACASVALFSLFVCVHLSHFLGFLCFRIQFAYFCLNNGIPLITIWCCFSSIFVNLASLQVLGDNVCPLHLSPSTACLLASNLHTNSSLGMLRASFLAMCPRPHPHPPLPHHCFHSFYVGSGLKFCASLFLFH